MKAHPAQPDNLPTQRAISMLESSSFTLRAVAEELKEGVPSKAGRNDIRRILSGVLADVEIVRLALETR